MQIDLDSENLRSIAWIDVNGKCLLPGTFIGGKFADLSGNLKIHNNDISNFDENLSSQHPKIELRVGRLVIRIRGTEGIWSVDIVKRWKRKRLKGNSLTNQLEGIKNYGYLVVPKLGTKLNWGLKRLLRGYPKMAFAWHRTSADGVASILSYEFGNPSKDGKVAKEMLLKLLRSIVQDEMLHLAVREIRG